MRLSEGVYICEFKVVDTNTLRTKRVDGEEEKGRRRRMQSCQRQIRAVMMTKESGIHGEGIFFESSPKWDTASAWLTMVREVQKRLMLRG